MSSPSLLVFAETEVDERAVVTRLGGRPLAPKDFVWPSCGDCQRPLQFLAQLLMSGAELLLLFSCHLLQPL